MITGTVNRRYELVVRLPVRDASGQEHDIDMLIDTGFTGSLTLPPALIAKLRLPWRSRSSAILANGNVERFDIYAATVIWDGAPRQILVQAIDNVPLVGMALLAHHDLRARVTLGGSLQIEAMP